MNKYLTPDELSSFTGLSKKYIYNLVSRREIPFYKFRLPNQNGSKKLLFGEKEVAAWFERRLKRVEPIQNKVDEIMERIG